VSSANAATTDLVARVVAGEQRATARLMRLIDDRVPGYLAHLKALYPYTGKAYVLGITGSPGAGKSTLVDRMIEHQRALGRKVGVLAVDPSSPFTGGAILGDRIRMQRHFLDDQVFIRSLATRGHMGGLSRSAGDVMRVLDAFGCDVILVETVGVGQDELEIARLAHTAVVVMAPGGGDDIQAIKAGILEIADVFVVNKADRDGADNTVRDLEGMLALNDALVHAGAVHKGHSAAMLRMVKGATKEGDVTRWSVPVVKTVATRNEGISELMTGCEQHRAFLFGTEAGRVRLQQRREDELSTIFRDRLLAKAEQKLGTTLEQARASLSDLRADPYVVAEDLVIRVID
jgi:LAO/AO transport system kinase